MLFKDGGDGPTQDDLLAPQAIKWSLGSPVVSPIWIHSMTLGSMEQQGVLIALRLLGQLELCDDLWILRSGNFSDVDIFLDTPNSDGCLKEVERGDLG